MSPGVKQAADEQWEVAERSIGIISICIPSWFYLFKRAKQYGISTLFTLRNPEVMAMRERHVRGAKGETCEADKARNTSDHVPSRKDVEPVGARKDSDTSGPLEV